MESDDTTRRNDHRVNEKVHGKEIVSENEDKGNEDPSTSKGCRTCCLYNNVKSAQAFALIVTGRGVFLVSFLFMTTSLVYLASEEAGCVNEEEKSIIPNCTKKVYGFRPSSLISNVAVISGILSALLMPLIGALVDYTSYRRVVGIISSAMMTLSQAILIGSVQSTWFAMTILVSILGFIGEIQYCAYQAYLPEMAVEVGEEMMTGFTAKFMQIQSGSEIVFLIVVSALGIGLNLHNVKLAQISQGINAVWIGVPFVLGWMRMPNVPAKHTLPENHYLFIEGFAQNWRTAKSVNKHYGHSLRWFLLTALFADTGISAGTLVVVSFYTETLGMSSGLIGIHFIITLLFTIPGAQLSATITQKTNPPTSWRLWMIAYIVVTAIAAAILDKPERSNFVYLFSVLWGITLGGFFTTENLFFSMCLPKGQETELSGFFVYSTQIIAWFPPLVFTLLNEAKFHQRWGVLSLDLFVILGLIMTMFLPSWDEVLKEVQNIGSKVEATKEGMDVEALQKEVVESTEAEKEPEAGAIEFDT